MAQRWLLVGLAVLLGALLWTIAAWPVAQAPHAGDAAAGSRAQAVTTRRTQLPPAAAPEPRAPEAAEVAPTAQVPAEPAAPEAADTDMPPDTEAEADKIFIRENGPLAEYKRRFETEPRDSAAHEAEQTIQQAFVSTDGPGPVFRAVLCRESICKIDVRVSSENLGAYVAAMSRIVQGGFGSKLATERTSLAEGGEVSVSVYAERAPTQP